VSLIHPPPTIPHLHSYPIFIYTSPSFIPHLHLYLTFIHTLSSFIPHIHSFPSTSHSSPHGNYKLTLGSIAYASTLINLSSLHSTLLISLLNLSSAAGTILIGSLTDHLHPTSVILISALGSALAVFLIWGFALSKPVIYIFALAYGIFAGGYTATWTGCVSEIQRDVIEAEAGVVIGMMAAGRGLGAVMSGPVSESLLGYESWNLTGAYGTKYGILIVFTGITAVLGGFGSLSRLRFRGVDQDSIMSTMDIRTSHEETR